MTQYPKSLLQSESQPWGRSVEQRLADLERQGRLVAQESGNNFSQVNGTLNRLTEFYSIAANSTMPFQQFGGFTEGYFLYPFSAPEDPSVTITSNTGKILLTISADCYFFNTNPDSAMSIFFHFDRLGVPTDVSNPGLVFSAVGVNNTGFTSSFTTLFTLPPGEHTFRVRRARQLSSTGGLQVFNTENRLLIAQSIP